MTVQILAEYDDFIVTLKPPGLGFHVDAMPAQETLPQAAGHVAAVRALLAARGDERPLYPLHRLDRITSGLVLMARSAQAARDFGVHFAEGRIEKLYLALSDRKPVKKQGTLRGSMVRARGGSWRLSRDPQAGPLVLTQFHAYTLAGDGMANTHARLRLFVLRPRTGRTHQLRVALKSLGSPILGDVRYGGSAAERGYLHAWWLRFDWQGQRHEYCAPPAPGRCFVDAPCLAKLAELGDPWALAWPRLER